MGEKWGCRSLEAAGQWRGAEHSWSSSRSVFGVVMKRICLDQILWTQKGEPFQPRSAIQRVSTHHEVQLGFDVSIEA